MGIGDDLLAIIKEERQIAQQKASEPVLTCPYDGVPLVVNEKTGAMTCPYGDYTTTMGGASAKR